MYNQARPSLSPTSSIGTSDTKIYMSAPAVPLALPTTCIQDNKTAKYSNLFRPRKSEVHPFVFAEELLAMIDEKDQDENDSARRLAQACQA